MWTVVAAVVAVVVAVLAATKGRGTLDVIKQALAKLGLTSDVMARSLSMGFVLGTLPLYVPTIPTVVCGALAKLFGLSVPASIMGLNIATPFFMVLMVPFIRFGETLSGSDALPLDGLMDHMRADMAGAFQTFGGRIAMGVLSWACATPVLFFASYFVFLPFCRMVDTKKS
mmetsp:Transcript_82255/g.236387  ORF Transcript_82255/g.236387 Transcript_82255/m.236387 type:complete len:171 (+) Transcript_82255:64-576(+)